MGSELATLQLPADIVVYGAITGMVYGVSAVGLILVYRSTKVINFAHGQVGTMAAAFLGLAARDWHLPYWFGFLIALARFRSLPRFVSRSTRYNSKVDRRPSSLKEGTTIPSTAIAWRAARGEPAMSGR